MKHATSRLLFSYWDTLRGERAAPERSDVDPVGLREVLADTFILEVTRDGSASVRLAGTRVSALFGRNLKDAPFDGLWPEAGRAEARDLVEIVNSETTGLVAGLVGTTAIGFTISLELLLLPLRHRGSPSTRILGSLSPSADPSWLGMAPLNSLELLTLRIIHSAERHPTEIEDVAATASARRSRFVLLEGGLAH